MWEVVAALPLVQERHGRVPADALLTEWTAHLHGGVKVNQLPILSKSYDIERLHILQT